MKHERIFKMKKIIRFAAVLFVFITVLSVVACNERDVWKDATYTENTELGEGKTQITVVVEAQGKSVTLTVNTDKDNLGEALLELGLINDPSFFDTVNGMRLDWNEDKAYWGFYKNGEYMTVGADEAPLAGVEQYELVYTKG